MHKFSIVEDDRIGPIGNVIVHNDTFSAYAVDFYTPRGVW